MDGLEAVEVRLSDANANNSEWRIDSEFFRKRYLVEEMDKNKFGNITLGEVAFITDGQHGYHEIDESSNISHITAKNTKAWFADNLGCDRLSQRTNENNKRSILEVDDILLSTRGSVGYCAIVTNDILPSNIDQDIARILIFEKNKILPCYLLAYMNSKYGQDWATRNSTGMVQQGLALDKVRKIIMPLLDMKFQTALEGIILKAYNIARQSKALYTFAETILLSHLGLADYIPNKESVAIKSFSSSFGATGRLDGEYYQPKYDGVLQAVSSHNQSKLSDIVTIKKSIEPGSDAYGDDGIPFVRVSNLSKFELSKPDIKIPLTTVQNISELYPKKNTILLSKDGSVGIAYKVSEDMQCVTSGAILHLTVKNKDEVLPDYLTLVLNSIIVQMQAERDAGGSIIQHWKPSEIEDVSIPILGKPIQTEIAVKVQESFALRKKSVELLDLAKTAVEVGIEQGETVGIDLLNTGNGGSYDG